MHERGELTAAELHRLRRFNRKLQHVANCEQLRGNFENREAIYIEKGACRVRITNIQSKASVRMVRPQVEEILTPGLRHPLHVNQPNLVRWEIGGGYITLFPIILGSWATVVGGSKHPVVQHARDAMPFVALLGPRQYQAGGSLPPSHEVFQ